MQHVSYFASPLIFLWWFKANILYWQLNAYILILVFHCHYVASNIIMNRHISRNMRRYLYYLAIPSDKLSLRFPISAITSHKYWQLLKSTEIWVNIGSGNGLLPDGTKPLPEPMLTDHQWSPMTVILGQFHKRCLNHESLKSVWKLYWVFKCSSCLEIWQALESTPTETSFIFQTDRTILNINLPASRVREIWYWDVLRLCK